MNPDLSSISITYGVTIAFGIPQRPGKSIMESLGARVDEPVTSAKPILAPAGKTPLSINPRFEEGFAVLAAERAVIFAIPPSLFGTWAYYYLSDWGSHWEPILEGTKKPVPETPYGWEVTCAFSIKGDTVIKKACFRGESKIPRITDTYVNLHKRKGFLRVLEAEALTRDQIAKSYGIGRL